MRIAIYPLVENSSNKYIDRMIEAIKYAFPSVIISPIPRMRKILSLKKYDFVWINWFENLPENGVIKNALIKVLIFISFKLMRVKIISTFHNRQPHEFRNRFCDKLLFSMTFRCANKIIILSSDSKPILIEKFGESILRKTILVPHPSYNCTPKSQILKSRNFKVLFFGNLRPYKNIELIFEIAKRHPDTIFTIAGNPIDEKYKFELIRASDHLANIRLIPHLLSDAEIDELIEENSIMLLPYSTESSLNSGVVIHAICKGINVIVPSIGTVNQLNNKNDVFSYTYQSYDEHIEQLSKMLSLAKEEYINNYEKFVNRISRLYNEVSSNQSPVSISPQLKQVFQ